MAKSKKDDDGLAEIISDSLNKLFKDKNKVAYIGEEESPTDLTDFVSTGSSILDLAISNRAYGGLAFGRIYELSGLEGSGKSLVSAHLMANTQKMGGIAVLIDTESAVNWDFFDSVGVDRKKNWVYAQIETLEDIFESVISIIETVRKTNKDKPVTIVIDSIAGASTKDEMSADFDRQGYATGKALILSTALRKITNLIARQKVMLVLTNQLREKLNAMPFGDKYTTPGGKAIGFHSSARLRLTQVSKIKIKDNNSIVGVNVKAEVKKNRLGPPHRTAEFDIYFDRGIDDLSSWIPFLKERKIISAAGAYIKYEDIDGKEQSISSADFKNELSSNDKLKSFMYDKMCESMIMLYNTENVTENDIEFENGDDE